VEILLRRHVREQALEAIGIDHGGEAYGLAWNVCLHAGPDTAIPEIVGFLLQPRAYEESLAKLYRECGYSADSIAPRQASLAFALALDVLVNLLPRSSDPGRWRSALTRLAQRGDVQIAYPVHRNPNVLEPVHRLLGGQPNILLLEPLDYVPFVDLMRRATLILTDSGGIQEEGPSLGKPILVLREKTERPEAVEAGTVKLVGTDEEKIVSEAVRLLDNQEERERMSRVHNPYGDGQASRRIADAIAGFRRVGALGWKR